MKKKDDERIDELTKIGDNSYNSQQEKCRDTPTQQHRKGTNPEEWKVSKENKLATADSSLRFGDNSEVKDDK